MGGRKTFVYLIFGTLLLASVGCGSDLQDVFFGSSGWPKATKAPMGDDPLKAGGVSELQNFSHTALIEPEADRAEKVSSSASYRLVSGKLITE